MKILLVDDEVNILSSIERILTGSGHLVHCTTDVEKAVEMVADGGYDFALVDYMMPLHDGIWFMKNARIPKTTKVLLMTAHVDRQIIKDMLGLGARGYLIKPLDKEDLQTHLDFHSSTKQGGPRTT